MNGKKYVIKKNLILILLSLSISLAGCATSKETYTSSGNKGSSINCSGVLVSWDACYKEAGKICKSRGYTLLDKQESRSSVYNYYYGVNQPVINRTMLIECN
jgi:hypothetical protein